MSSVVVGWLPEYGVAALFLTLVASAFGIPFPGTLLLIVVGSLIAQGQLPLWPALIAGTAGAVLGDQLGYALGRWGGERAVLRVFARANGPAQMRRAHAFAGRWGAVAIFFTRWLVGPLGPWVNLSSGIAAYPWASFLFWDALGEIVWVVLYVMVGKVFSNQIAAIADFSANIGWALVGVVVATFCAWRTAVYLRRHASTLH